MRDWLSNPASFEDNKRSAANDLKAPNFTEAQSFVVRSLTHYG